MPKSNSVLTPDCCDKVIAALTFGVSLRVAAAYSGCSAAAIQDCALRDGRFGERIKQAKRGYAIALNQARIGLSGDSDLMHDVLEWLSSHDFLIGGEFYERPARFQTTVAAVQDRPLDPETGYGYGFCPTCSAPGTSCERSPDGKTYCENGHGYPHNQRVYHTRPEVSPK